MKRNNFYNIINEETENLTCEELKELVKNMSRKIPIESQYEVIRMIKKKSYYQIT